MKNDLKARFGTILSIISNELKHRPGEACLCDSRRYTNPTYSTRLYQPGFFDLVLCYCLPISFDVPSNFVIANTRGSLHQDYGEKFVGCHVDQQKGQVEKQGKECPSWKLCCFKYRQLGHKVSECQRKQRGELERRANSLCLQVSSHALLYRRSKYRNASNISHFRVFGCRVFYFERKPGKEKLGPRGQEGIFRSSKKRKMFIC